MQKNVKQCGSNELVKSNNACPVEKKSEATEYKNKRQKNNRQAGNFAQSAEEVF